MYGDEFISLDHRSGGSGRNVRFLEMALPGLCMTCASNISRTRGGPDLKIVDPSCDNCAHTPLSYNQQPKFKDADSSLIAPQWWTDGMLRSANPNIADFQLQLPEQHHQKQLQQQLQHHPRYVHRLSWDSAFSTDGFSLASSKGVDESVTTHSSISSSTHRSSKPSLFSHLPAHENPILQQQQQQQQSIQQQHPHYSHLKLPPSPKLEWPDWSKWTSSDYSRGSFDSLDSAPLYSESIDSLDEAPCLSRSPSPVPETDESTPLAAPIVDMQQALMHPAKTGFALWVGNLSPKTTLSDLRILFGTPDLQSIYLIQRTGCAFVNYTSLNALNTAMELFTSRGASLHDNSLVIKSQVSNAEEERCSTGNDCAVGETTAPTSAPDSPDRFFICKSLTVDDLELAKKTGRWSTQLRNKDKFNLAYEQGRNTYLVFSANRTSAFYGIARLEEPFCEPQCELSGNDDLSTPGKTPNGPLEECVQPEVFVTERCEHPLDGIEIPMGETVFDPLRGSQFWKVKGCACVEPETEKWTSPARISWISDTNSIIPFSRTRQLKNSLNMNKPIKVARDGTEIDPEVGEKLFSMFLAV